MIGIVDCGIGNIASVENALIRLGCDAERLTEPGKMHTYDRLVLPGVGSFQYAMGSMQDAGWVDAIHVYAASGRPVLGICLGMQLLFSRGLEHGDTAGLGLIPGEVRVLEPEPPCKLPHVGWNTVSLVREHPLFRRVRSHVDFYFVHSYQCVPRDEADIIARCDYGGSFVASVVRGNIAGMQFHPEKSQPAGLKILENFADWTPEC